MDVAVQLFVFVLSWFVNRGKLVSLDAPYGPSFVTRISDDMDQQFFAQLPANKAILQVWRSDSKRLVVTSDNPLHSLSLMEAPALEELQIFPNTRLDQLIICHCPWDRLEKSLYNLQALNLLKIEKCRMNGTFNLAELLPLQSLTSLSFEANRLTDIILQQDETANETELISPLQVLNLCGNRMEYFNLDVLRNFPDLKDLLLQRNMIVRIIGSVLLPTLATVHVGQNHLTELNLMGCNCSALLHMYASVNKLSSFPLLGDSLTNLQVLDLKNNQLATLNVTELKKLQNLRTLILSNNDLKSFSIEDADELPVELPMLRVLELNANEIETLSLRGWQFPSLQVLVVNRNPLISLPDDLVEQFPKLINFSCLCADIDCEWIQQHMQHVRNGRFEMSVAWQGPKDVSDGYRCVTVPHIGCVQCPFKRQRNKTTNAFL